jgi:hypothetical protein
VTGVINGIFYKLCTDVSKKREKRTNLIMAQRGKQWIAPQTFEGSCDWERVNEWIKKKSFPALKKPSIIVFDNASFHKKKDIRALCKKHGYIVLPILCFLYHEP